ncbi:decaprenyl-phosphate phosphoribosyltransferase [Subtercola boreus]|uniref:Decaprenyl-phosphate phosphoribosyltransferase n=2 Tax=Subtercola boreus TaxID=120213 RepID=A0A3E0WDC9_9MICO|nr:decaprenyl-phosphate phosphoribosyltransferase [Subtercola boreus]RFA22906.1 decaprenyl-phosphate phosphoribosyltransferase [Subtercola boreus]RFA28928.1 decaprenyl-phosphate phosphoribosyltransferase [Subtercola boreus]
MRPKQWLKNVLLALAPLSAGVILEPGVIPEVVLAIIAFSLTSSGGYMLNDLLDIESDRLHPKKRFRPIPSGEFPSRVAWPTSIVLLIAPAAIALLLGYATFGVVLAAYVVIQVSYCIWLKHQPVIDIIVVASGFVLRAIAGAAVVGVPVTQWFLLVISSGSLFMVAGKRYSEKVSSEGNEAAHTRKTLDLYSLGYLRFVWTVAATLTMLSYAMWAFDLNGGTSIGSIASIVPFGVALLLYAFDIERGEAAAPEEVVFKDLKLFAVGGIWAALFLVSVLARQYGWELPTL